MKLSGHHRVLMFLYGLSYIGIKESLKEQDLGRWMILSGRFDRLLNKQVISFVASRNENIYSCKNKNLLLESFENILRSHFRFRVKIFRALRFIGLDSRKSFLFLSLLVTYLNEFKNFLRGIPSLRFGYNTIDVGKNIIIAIGFPEHSFSIDGVVLNRDRNIVSSFGEYLVKRYRNSNVGVVSANEYIRVSKSNRESTSHCIEKAADFPVHRLTRTSSIWLFIKGWVAIISAIFKNQHNMKFGSIIMRLIYLTKNISDINLNRMLKAVGSDNNNLLSIYHLPFADVGLLKYSEAWGDKLCIYHYSDNDRVPRLCDLNKIENEFNLTSLMSLPLENFLLDSNSVGFYTSATYISLVTAKINEKYGCIFTCADTCRNHKEPMILGYETYASVLSRHTSPIVGIFDLAPADWEVQMSWFIMGYKICDFKVIEGFILDVVSVCVGAGFKVAFKPKYAVAKYGKEYQDLLMKISNTYGENIIFVDPYLRFQTLLEKLDIVLVMPYSSPGTIARALGIPYAYYLPKKYEKAFASSGNIEDTIFGKDSLNQFLKREL